MKDGQQSSFILVFSPLPADHPAAMAVTSVDLAPSLPVLGLGGAAFAFYVAARLGADALTVSTRDRPSAVGARALAHWLPMAAIAVLLVKDQPEGAISVIFAASV